MLFYNLHPVFASIMPKFYKRRWTVYYLMKTLGFSHYMKNVIGEGLKNDPNLNRELEDFILKLKEVIRELSPSEVFFQKALVFASKVSSYETRRSPITHQGTLLELHRFENVLKNQTSDLMFVWQNFRAGSDTASLILAEHDNAIALALQIRVSILRAMV